MKRDTGIVMAVGAVIPAAILGAAVLCSRAIAEGASARWRLAFRVLCHGIEERCLRLWEVPMPICARCTAIYAGLLAGLGLFVVGPKVSERAARLFALAAVVPLAIDGLTQLAGLRESSNPLRMATGALAGLAFGFWILCAVERGSEDIVTTS